MVVSRGDEFTELAAKVRHVGEDLPHLEHEACSWRAICVPEVVTHLENVPALANVPVLENVPALENVFPSVEPYGVFLSVSILTLISFPLLDLGWLFCVCMSFLIRFLPSGDP